MLNQVWIKLCFDQRLLHLTTSESMHRCRGIGGEDLLDKGRSFVRRCTRELVALTTVNYQSIQGNEPSNPFKHHVPTHPFQPVSLVQCVWVIQRELCATMGVVWSVIISESAGYSGLGISGGCFVMVSQICEWTKLTLSFSFKVILFIWKNGKKEST